MILQALVEYYEDLAKRGEVEKTGWSKENISYALEINEYGELIRVMPLLNEEERGKKKILVPQQISVPTPVKRASGKRANFLWDNAGYMLGIGTEEKADDAIDKFRVSRELHMRLLSEVNEGPGKALKRFFEDWEPQRAGEHPALINYIEDIKQNANLIFFYEGSYVSENKEIIESWDKSFSPSNDEKAICMVTGVDDITELIHPNIKKVNGAQSSGAALVSFNADSFCSFGKEQGMNAPIGKYAAFAYTTALNKLVSDYNHRNYIGDTLVVCWSAGAEDDYATAFNIWTFGDKEKRYDEKELRSMLSHICKGNQTLFNDTLLDPQREFYVLGISPNAARLSVRFFIRNSFGKMLQNIEEHQKRLEIIKSEGDRYESIPVWRLVDGTVNKNSRDKKPSSVMTGELLRAILNNTGYPTTFINGVMLRIRAEHEIDRVRAASIKAYYLKNRNKFVPEEVLTVSLNTETKNTAYVLGRLFAILEAIQKKANPGINATIKDKYFNSAASTPGIIYPSLINLAQKHLRKIEGGLKVHYERQLGEILDLIGENFPTRLTLPEQGAFQLGYYHQNKALYQKKNVNEEE